MNKIIFPIIYLSIWFTLYLMPRESYHIGFSSGIDGLLLLLTFFILLPYTFYLSLVSYKIGSQIAKLFAFFSFTFMFPFMFFVSHQDDNELETLKVYQKGVIISAEMKRKRKTGKVWKVKAKYKVKNKFYYTTFQDDRGKIFHVGDTVTIIYSSKTPEIYEIVELVEHYGK